METNSQCPVSKGIWSRPRLQPSTKESRDMLDLMKQESRLANFQRKQNNQSPKNSSPMPPPSRQSLQIHRPYVSQKRSAESCRAGNGYTREMFHPSATRDLEEEKRKLQDLFSMGTDVPPAAPPESPPEQKDRYEQLIDEIVERRQFLAEMTALGQDRDCLHIINTEISQKMRELELLDKQREQTTGSEAAEESEAPTH